MIYPLSLNIKSLKISSAILLQVCLIINAHAQHPATSRPNIIFILADDVGYSVPAINGGQSYSTPRIDSMARHGMNFTHCEAAPLCSPSRFMFLTGKYNFRNYSNWAYMSDTEKTIANVMHDAGYVTGIFGKLQLPYQYNTMHNWGWDSHSVFELTEDTMAYRRYKSPVLMKNGYRIPDNVTVNKYGDDILTQQIFDFIDSNKTKPFFVYYSMSIGHAPYCPTPDDAAFATWNPYINKSDTSFFPSMMHYMDKKIGAILDWLHSNGLDQNTIVLYAGDNGVPPEIYYNANGVLHIKGEKGNSSEGGTHVPLIAYWPGHIRQGSVNDDLIDFIDFLPTFAEAAQITDLSKYGILDGSSFYPAIFEQAHTVKQQLFGHVDEHPGFSNLRRWVRDKVYKLYDSTGIPRAGKFYNTVSDEPEAHPLINLTQSELLIKQKFRNILDTIGNWPEAPAIENAFSHKITNTSAIVTATIISRGASKLIDRGSSIVAPGPDAPYLQYGRMHDSLAKTGTFSQVRTGLLPQTQYRYSLYAMNKNASHSTSFAVDSFYTLSNPPLLQPAFFTAAVEAISVDLDWDNATFPPGGARNAGYLLVYSPGDIEILKKPNGKEPDSVVVHGQIVPLLSTVLPGLPATSAKVFNLSPGTYHFVLVPYTWNGSKTATYNYLTKKALTATATVTASFTIKLYPGDNNFTDFAGTTVVIKPYK